MKAGRGEPENNNSEFQLKTALVAALIGAYVMAPDSSQTSSRLDPRQAREISVLTRVLETRLSDVRLSLVIERQ